MMNKLQCTSARSLFWTWLVIVLVAMTTIAFNGNNVIVASTVSDDNATVSLSSSNSKLHRRRLNFLSDLWNDYGAPAIDWATDGIGSAFGGFFFGASDDEDEEFFIQGDDDSIIQDDNDDTFGNAVSWGNDGAWQDWLSIVLKGGFLDEILGDIELIGGLDLGDGLDLISNIDFEKLDEFDMCTVVELAIGMTPMFGRVANCDCDGNFRSGMKIKCGFDECVPFGSDVCGSVDLGFDFGTPDGQVKVTSCADISVDNYDETCFSYILDVRDFFGTSIDTQTCEATYGGNQCECSITNLCLDVDCSQYLPRGKMDTCQMLSMIEPVDIVNWFPIFDAFLPDSPSSNDNKYGWNDDDEELIVFQANELVNIGNSSSSSSSSSYGCSFPFTSNSIGRTILITIALSIILSFTMS